MEVEYQYAGLRLKYVLAVIVTDGTLVLFVYMQAIMYRKYSLASDVWSYGIILYEIWTVGRRPYDDSWSNNYLMEMLDEGYRLPPPPGSSYAIYKMMIQCW